MEAAHLERPILLRAQAFPDSLNQLVGETVWILSCRSRAESAGFSQLNLDGTQRSNATRGVEFSDPGSKEENPDGSQSPRSTPCISSVTIALKSKPTKYVPTDQVPDDDYQ